MAMSRLLIAVVAITALQFAAALECGKANEESRCIAKCPPEKTCRNRDIEVSCLQSATENCKDTCVCKKGFFRTDAGDCVTDDQCDNPVCTKPNEEKRCVTQCPPQKTCRTRDIKVKCLESATKNYKDTCVCKDGFYKNVVGECVSNDQCDQCSRQNQYYSCRTQPDKLCSDFKKSTDSSTDNNADSNADSADSSAASTADSSTTTQCKAQCYCAPGTARDENNECVPYDQCNKPCNSDETKDYCPTDCPSDYCPKSEPKAVSCPRPAVCPKPQCKCGFNYRRAQNGTCVPTRECPPFKCSKPFEEPNMCPPLCPNGGCGQATPNGECPGIFGRIGIVLVCNPECRCKKGYWWNGDRVCIPYNQCPGKGDTASSTTSSPETKCCAGVGPEGDK